MIIIALRYLDSKAKIFLALLILALVLYKVPTLKASITDDCSRISEIGNKLNYGNNIDVKAGRIWGANSFESYPYALLVQNVPSYSQLSVSSAVISIDSVTNGINQIHVGKSITVTPSSNNCGNNYIFVVGVTPQPYFISQGVSNPDGYYGLTYKLQFVETSTTTTTSPSGSYPPPVTTTSTSGTTNIPSVTTVPTTVAPPPYQPNVVPVVSLIITGIIFMTIVLMLRKKKKRRRRN